MKLLGWVHRKFRQNSGDPSRDFSTGNPCNCLSGGPSLDDDDQSYSRKHSKPPDRPISDQWTFYSDQGYHEDNIFNGLLTIGTLGLPTLTAGITDDVIVSPEDGTATPTFGVPPPLMDDITEKQEHTDVDLMVINSELEKLLVVPDSDPRISSARASYVSMKQLVITNNSMSSSCPLQEYLLGSSVDMGETTTEQNKVLRRQRTSLGELFMVEEGGGGGGGGGSKKEKPVVKVQSSVKNILKRHGSGTYCSDGVGGRGDGDDRFHDGHGCNSQSSNKFHKIIQMFHKKIHPENYVAAKKIVTKLRDGCAGTGGGTAAASGLGSNSTLSPVTASIASGSSESNGNREQWIKTDADYLVLEL